MCVFEGKFRAAKLIKMREALGQLAGITMLKQIFGKMLKGEMFLRVCIWRSAQQVNEPDGMCADCLFSLYQ